MAALLFFCPDASTSPSEALERRDSMNNKQHQEAVKKAVRAKFRGRMTVTSKYVPLYPIAAEREMKRVARDYLKLFHSEVKAKMPEIAAEYRKNRSDDTRFDDFSDLTRALRRIFTSISKSLEQSVGAFKLRKRLNRIAQMTRETSKREWMKAVHRTLGIDLLKDYYDGDFYEDTTQRWVADNVNKIRSIPASELGEMERIIKDGYLAGKPITEVAKDIQAQYNTTKSKAMFLARDQIGTLNSQITRHQQEDAGVYCYKWSDSGDERVRECHSTLNGQIFRWDDPPEMWYTTKKGVVYTGRRCHPGEDYSCRCCAVPVFDIKTIDLPMKGADEQNVEKGEMAPGFPLTPAPSFVELELIS